MNAADFSALGYRIIRASLFEIGLVKNGKGIRTWYNQEFDNKMPSLDHPLIREAMFRAEQYGQDTP